jgi:hypothetical protein
MLQPNKKFLTLIQILMYFQVLRIQNTTLHYSHIKYFFLCLIDIIFDVFSVNAYFYTGLVPHFLANGRSVNILNAL